MIPCLDRLAEEDGALPECWADVTKTDMMQVKRIVLSGVRGATMVNSMVNII